jgi:glycosyltransferase involved in cell wall biosynthesis
MPKRVVLIPVYNEEKHVEGLLARLREVYAGDVLFIDDGSKDRSPRILREIQDHNTSVLIQSENRGYGATLINGFREVARRGYEFMITMDSDGQHRPDWIPAFFDKIQDWDIVSGSRYCEEMDGNGAAPADRRNINAEITRMVNAITGYSLSDSFCGFKAYRTSALSKLDLTDSGYGMPLQVWLQARHLGLRVVELPVSRIYDDPNRTFGGDLDDPAVRLRYYQSIIQEERKRWNL